MTSSTTAHKIAFQPIRKPDAGSLIGVSYLSTFVRCPRKWYWKYAHPTEQPDGSIAPTGIEPPEVDKNLLLGGEFHKAIEVYYLSGCRDGQDTGAYDIDAAIATLEESHSKNFNKYQDTDEESDSLRMAKDMLYSYHEAFGPNSPAPDFPHMRIACDTETGEPLIEKEFITPLGYGNYYMTTKIDAIIEDRGFYRAFEHKTAAASYVRQRLSSIHFDAQMSGEIFAIRKHLAEGISIAGLKVNVIVKNRAKASKYAVAERESTDRSDAQLELFADSAVDVLRQIDARVQKHNEWLKQGVPLQESLSVWFPIHGYYNGNCQAYNRPCEYSKLCQIPERANSLLANYRRRTTVEANVTEE